ncbi:transposase [Sulfitobacter sp. JB4-11]|uniref:transposase n=1 Tax=Sulfitobacter rhodophyticola TaxID=3238304 RepID=UPI003D81BD78
MCDITYLSIRLGLLFLVAIMDWCICKVLAWRISNTLKAEFCVDTLSEAIHKFSAPDILNADQGSQVTFFTWKDRLRRSGIRISMDSNGRILDDIFAERLRRSMKYEFVFLDAWETGSAAKAGIRKWTAFHNHMRPRSALGGKPPALAYWLKKYGNQTDQPEHRVV